MSVVFVDWQAWRAADDKARRSCGPRSFLAAPERAPEPRPELADGPTEQRAMLPGMAAWLGARR